MNKNQNNKMIKTIILLAALTLASCGGGGGGGGGSSSGGGYTGGGSTGGSTGGGTTTPSHSQLATDFVNAMNNEFGYDVSLVKTHTLQDGYIVVRDYDQVDYDIYGYEIPVFDAYYIADYVYGENLNDYILDYDADIFYWVQDLYDGTFEGYDSYYGDYVLFEETSIAGKDLEKVGAMIEEIKVQKSAEKLATEFGLSEERSMKVAKLASQWGKASKGRQMTDADADAFSTELLGVNINEIKTAFKKSLEGDDTDMADLLEEAAEVNGTTPEHMNDLMNEFISK